MALVFRGATPYCYANSLAMVMGSAAAAPAPPPSALEVLTGSPFGAQWEENGLPFFDPPGWDPDLGLDRALDLLGWTCRSTGGGDGAAAVRRLRDATRSGPALVGPVDMGLLLHQPGAAGTADGTDHWVVVLAVEGDEVVFHDPEGFPFVTLPVAAFVAAWNSCEVRFARPFTLRSEFRRVREVDILDAVRNSLPAARRWVSGGGPDSGFRTRGDAGRGPSGAVEQLADRVRAGLDDRTRAHLVDFAVRVGTRRLADASYWLAEAGARDAAGIADRQARLLGGAQYHLVAGDTETAAAALRQLAGTYGEMGAALGEPSGR
ncbi:hypothetical protein AB0O01_10865 [Streptomyces sp. NPDC093252]|uniref:hypothetical protein n=1 Tax=Streptomyces sp. NPDC093252 TaxID=3154980 RepID=UPI00342334DD